MSDSEGGDGPCCWICLGTDGPLARPCACPRAVHARCLARWRLQQAGRPEEAACRFCGRDYAFDWRDQLRGPLGLEPAAPVMAVSVSGAVHKIRVRPGPEGKAAFRQQVRQLLGYDSSVEFDVLFECKVPCSGEKVQLAGFGAFDAATHCASVSAARRLARRREQQAAAGGGGGAAAPPRAPLAAAPGGRAAGPAPSPASSPRSGVSHFSFPGLDAAFGTDSSAGGASGTSGSAGGAAGSSSAAFASPRSPALFPSPSAPSAPPADGPGEGAAGSASASWLPPDTLAASPYIGSIPLHWAAAAGAGAGSSAYGRRAPPLRSASNASLDATASVFGGAPGGTPGGAPGAQASAAPAACAAPGRGGGGGAPRAAARGVADRVRRLFGV